MITLTAAMPSLAILQLHGNQLSSLGPLPPSALQQLEELDLDDNLLEEWEEVAHLGALPRLAHLRLNNNRLSELRPAPGSFPALRALQLSGNAISSLASVGALDALALAELRLRGNPVNRDGRDEATVRQLVVARVATLAMVNGSVVTETERKWAEIDYLKTHGLEYLAVTDLEQGEARAAAMEAFTAAHNRYQEVVARHGEPQRGEGVVVDTRCLFAFHLWLLVTFPTPPPDRRFPQPEVEPDEACCAKPWPDRLRGHGEEGAELDDGGQAARAPPPCLPRPGRFRAPRPRPPAA